VVELFDDSLLLKQALGPLRIYNVSGCTSGGFVLDHMQLSLKQK
jgi:hypothetical protein